MNQAELDDLVDELHKRFPRDWGYLLIVRPDRNDATKDVLLTSLPPEEAIEAIRRRLNQFNDSSETARESS